MEKSSSWVETISEIIKEKGAEAPKDTQNEITEDGS